MVLKQGYSSEAPAVVCVQNESDLSETASHRPGLRPAEVSNILMSCVAMARTLCTSLLAMLLKLAVCHLGLSVCGVCVCVPVNVPAPNHPEG